MNSNSVFENINCAMGCDRNDEVVLVGSDRIHGHPGNFFVVRCRTCNLMRTNPRPGPDSIGAFYPDDYGPYRSTRIAQLRPNTVRKSFFRRLREKIVNSNSMKIPSLAPGRMLEVGCASGSFLHQMAGRGWQVQGIEFSEYAAQAAVKLGYQVHTGALETAPNPEEPFDLIVGWMVLEHLHDPVGGLKKLRQWTKPGGWLVVSVPNANALSFKIFKEKWYDLHLPNHLYHFTPKTIKSALRASDWTLTNVYHQRTLSNMIASTGYLLYDNGYKVLGRKFIKFPESNSKWVYFLYPFALIFSIFGQTGRMTVWARAE